MEEKERVVRVSDIFALLLKKYKIVILFALLAMLLGCARGLYKSYLAKNNTNSIDLILTEAKDNITEAESGLARAKNDLNIHLSRTIPDTETDIGRTREIMQQLRNYTQNSLYFSMDALNCGMSRLTFSMGTGSSSDSDRVTSYASAIIFDEQVLSQIRDILGVDTDLSYVRELLSVSDEGGGFFTIHVVFNNPELAEQAVDCLYDALIAGMKTTRNLPQFTVVSRFTGYEVNREMSEKHNAIEDELLSLNRTIVDLNEMLKELNEQTEDLENNVRTAEDTLNKAQSALSSLRASYPNDIATSKGALRLAEHFGLIFFVAGLAVGIIAVLFGGFLSGKLNSRNDILSLFSYPIISVIPRKKRYLFEKTIRRLEGDPIVDYDSGLKTAAQSLLSVAGKKNTCLVYSSSSDIAENVSAATEGKINVCGNILENASAVKALEKYDSVVFVEQRGLSRIDLISGEIKLAEAMRKEIIGFILA